MYEELRRYAFEARVARAQLVREGLVLRLRGNPEAALQAVRRLGGVPGDRAEEPHE